MRSATTFLILVVMVTAVAAVAFSFDPANSSTGTSSQSISVAQNTTSTAATNDLQLRLSLNATSLMPGQSVAVSLEDYNMLSTVNNLTVVDNWPVSYLSIGPCGTLNLPIGFAVISGFYTGSNLSSAQPLQLYPSGVFFSCPMILAGITSYAFSPMNSTAGVYAMCTPEPCFMATMNTTSTVSGYWKGPSPGAANFENFSPGVYTVVAGDEWGNILLLHFSVVS